MAERGAKDRKEAATTKPCPICGRPSEPDTQPFCSKRCADVDLNRWLRGVYAVPVEEGERIGDDDEGDGG